jgi:hypothetical protein
VVEEVVHSRIEGFSTGAKCNHHRQLSCLGHFFSRKLEDRVVQVLDSAQLVEVKLFLKPKKGKSNVGVC